MSVMYYIASNRELPIGESGIRKLKSADNPKMIRFIDEEPSEGSVPLESIIDLSGIPEDEIECYQSYEDAAGICIREIRGVEECVRIQFQNKWVYSLQATWGNFTLNEVQKIHFPQMYKANMKCITELMDYCKRNMNGEMELYICWAGDEGKIRDQRTDKVISMGSIRLEAFSECIDSTEQQYILLK